MMSRPHLRLVTAAGLALALALIAGGPGPAHAQPGRGDLVLTVSESVDPVPGGGDVGYSISIKNTGSIRAKEVRVTADIPAGTTFVKCSTSSATPPLEPCGLVGNTARTEFQYIPAHKTATLSLTLKMPSPAAPTQISLHIAANGEQAGPDDITVSTTVLGVGTTGRFEPSGRTVSLSCGTVLNFAAFKPPGQAKADRRLVLLGHLGCPNAPVGLRIAASRKTLNLNGFKIIGSSSSSPGSTGIAVAMNKVNVKIRGGDIGGDAGVEHFDWCVADEGGNDGLIIETLRCFRGRSAGIDLISNNVTVRTSMVDRATGGSSATTHELPGASVSASASPATRSSSRTRPSRRSKTYGIWATGVDTSALDGDPRTITIRSSSSTGTRTMRVESNLGVGIRVDGQGVHVEDPLVQGDWKAEAKEPTSTTGVVVEATATGAVLNGVQVKQFGANGFVVAGPGTLVTESSVEEVAADGFVITGNGVVLENNTSQAGRHGYVLSGSDILASTNVAEEVGGDGFVVTATGAGALIDNSAAENGAGHGFVVEGLGAILDTNTAEGNAGDGFHVVGSAAAGFYEQNEAKKIGAIGFRVLGQENRLHHQSGRIERRKRGRRVELRSVQRGQRRQQGERGAVRISSDSSPVTQMCDH